MTSFLYTSPGTYTWMCPKNCYQVYAIVIGGGGGGAGYPYLISTVTVSNMSGGAGGGLGIGVYSTIPYTNYIINVGSGGLRGGYSGISTFPGNGLWSGGNGGTSSFGSFLSCTGGLGGTKFDNGISLNNLSLGGIPYGYNIYGWNGGRGGSPTYPYDYPDTNTYGVSAGGGGLCGSPGGGGTNNNSSPYSGYPGGGGIFSNSRPSSTYSEHNGGSSGINLPCEQGLGFGQTEYSCSIFSGSSFQNNPSIDADGRVQGSATTKMGGCPNVGYRSSNNPPHLEMLQKIFKLTAGTNTTSTGQPVITGGTSQINHPDKEQGAVLIGGGGGGASNGGSVGYEYCRPGFGCGGGCPHGYYGTVTNQYRIGQVGGNGLVYLEW